MPTWPFLFDRKTMISNCHSHKIQAPLHPCSTLYNDMAREGKNILSLKGKFYLTKIFPFIVEDTTIHHTVLYYVILQPVHNSEYPC